MNMKKGIPCQIYANWCYIDYVNGPACFCSVANISLREGNDAINFTLFSGLSLEDLFEFWDFFVVYKWKDFNAYNHDVQNNITVKIVDCCNIV